MNRGASRIELKRNHRSPVNLLKCSRIAYLACDRIPNLRLHPSNAKGTGDFLLSIPSTGNEVNVHIA